MSTCSCEKHQGLQIVKAGFLRKFKKGFLSKGFKVVYVEVSKDGYLLWYRDEYSQKRDGVVDLKNVCDFLAVGPYTRSIPSRVILPKCVPERNLIAVPSAPSRHSFVYWFMCADDLDLNDWMMTINCVLLPPKDSPRSVLASHSKNLLETPSKSNNNNNNNNTKNNENNQNSKTTLFTYPGSNQDLRKFRDTTNPSSPYESILSTPTYASIASSSSSTTEVDALLIDKMSSVDLNAPLTTTTHNGSRLVIPPPPSKSPHLPSNWGWLWGCGMGWGVEGWHVYDFMMGTQGEVEALKVAIEATNDNNYDLSEQHFNDYDCGEVDVSYGDIGFDTSLDIGGFFDAGFSLGF